MQNVAGLDLGVSKNVSHICFFSPPISLPQCQACYSVALTVSVASDSLPTLQLNSNPLLQILINTFIA